MRTLSAAAPAASHRRRAVVPDTAMICGARRDTSRRARVHVCMDDVEAAARQDLVEASRVRGRHAPLDGTFLESLDRHAQTPHAVGERTVRGACESHLMAPPPKSRGESDDVALS